MCRFQINKNFQHPKGINLYVLLVKTCFHEECLPRRYYYSTDKRENLDIILLVPYFAASWEGQGKIELLLRPQSWVFFLLSRTLNILIFNKKFIAIFYGRLGVCYVKIMDVCVQTLEYRQIVFEKLFWFGARKNFVSLHISFIVQQKLQSSPLKHFSIFFVFNIQNTCYNMKTLKSMQENLKVAKNFSKKHNCCPFPRKVQSTLQKNLI